MGPYCIKFKIFCYIFFFSNFSKWLQGRNWSLAKVNGWIILLFISGWNGSLINSLAGWWKQNVQFIKFLFFGQLITTAVQFQPEAGQDFQKSKHCWVIVFTEVPYVCLLNITRKITAWIITILNRSTVQDLELIKFWDV